MLGVESGNLCHTGNDCEYTIPNGEACSSHIDYSSKFIPPGELCVQALWQKYVEIANPHPSIETLDSRDAVIEAGYLIELAVMKTVNETEANGYFAKAKSLLDHESDNRHSRHPHRYNARLWSLYLPSFAAYRYGCAPPPRVFEKQHTGLRALMAHVRNAPVHKDLFIEHIEREGHRSCFAEERFQKAACTKLAFLGLCHETGLAFLPATSRSNNVCDAFIFVDGKLVPTRVVSSNQDRGDKTKQVIISFASLAHDANCLDDKKRIFSGGDADIAQRVKRRLENGPSPVQNDVQPRIERVVGRMGAALKEKLRAYTARKE